MEKKKPSEQQEINKEHGNDSSNGNEVIWIESKHYPHMRMNPGQPFPSGTWFAVRNGVIAAYVSPIRRGTGLTWDTIITGHSPYRLYTSVSDLSKAKQSVEEELNK